MITPICDLKKIKFIQSQDHYQFSIKKDETDFNIAKTLNKIKIN